MNNILEKINKAAIKFLTPLTLEETYPVIVHEALKLMDAQRGSIFLPDPSTGLLTRVYSSYENLYKIQIRKKGITYTTFKTRKAIIINKPSIINRIQPEFRKVGVKSLISLPLSYKNKSIGVLSIHSFKKANITEKELDTFKLYSTMASLAIRKAQLNNETQKALETRDLFISMAAHELRTPLTTINGYIQLLYTRLYGRNTSESRWVEELMWETSRLTQLVSELLEVNRIKSGQFDYKWRECHLKQIIHRALSIAKFTHPDRKIILHDKVEEGKDIIIGDYDKLLQVLTNLLDNAAKFSSPEQPITISLTKKGKNLIIEVRDEGHGIPKKDLEQIFETYYRGEHQVEGMGLGLALVKYIIANHHGDVKIKSKINKGTSLQVELPQATL